MHPISLEFQAFGPYKGHETINFRDLAQNGLFLICGETGSGKTMILDAITFALYGQSSGNNRDDLTQLRCNRCDPSDPTFVKFVFEEKGSVYSFERRLEMKRVNLAAKQSLLKLNDQGVWEPVFENCKAKEMTAKAAEIIGLDYNQFRQVIILPQGKFEKLLTSNSDEKEKILVNIFGADKWQRIAEKYYESAKARKDALTDKKKLMDASLAEEGCADLAELKELLDAGAGELQELEKQYKAADYPKREEELSGLSGLAKEFSQLYELEAQLAALEGRKDQIEIDRKTLAEAVIAENARGPIEKLKEKKKAAQAREAELEQLQTESMAAETEFSRAGEALKEHEAKAETRQSWEKQKTLLESKTDIYKGIDQLEKQEKEAEIARQQAEAGEKKSQSALDKATAETQSCFTALNAASENTRALRTSYMAGITGFIAAELEDGQPCPVCGSLEHPRKAPIAEGSASKEAVDEADASEELCRKNWKAADEKRKSAEAAWKKQNDALLQAQTALEKAKAEHQSARRNLIEGIADLAELNSQIKGCGDAIKEYDRKKELLTSAFDTAKQKSEAIGTRIKTAEEELKKAKDEASSAEQALISVLREHSLSSMEEAISRMLSDSERSSLSKKIDQYSGSLDTLKGQINDKLALLRDRQEPDPAAISAELRDIDEKKRTYERTHSSLSTRQERLEGKYSQLKAIDEKYRGEIQDAEDDFTFAKNLRGDTGIGLQRYVLGIMFSSVIQAANEMLRRVHGGRYQLFRTDEKVDGSNKRGLDLKVYDSYAGGSEGRSVSTLSGGEKFLASLALSIGMSTIAKTGGVNIDGIFIDEGFGSLDNDSIDDALDILGSIQRAHGMVGIISHVEVLRSNIPTKIQVVKRRESSTIE
jgi:DNA repair exonuclease SbcCD ATPase subunit